MSDDEEEKTPWDDFLSDFTLILDSGERIRCHKFMLAKASPVLKAMLMSEMKEAKTNEMSLKGFDLETVTSFLSYIYAEEDFQSKISDTDGLLGFKKHFYIPLIGDKLSPQVMRLAHMYEVNRLVQLCEINLTIERPFFKTWTAKDIQKLGKDLDNQLLKERSEMWQLADAFQALTCGNCKKETKDPPVKLQCTACNHFTEMSWNQPCVDYGEGKYRLSTVKINFPSTE